MRHPSLEAYNQGCHCPGCTERNRRYMASYRQRRLANNGQPLDPRHYQMPGTLMRLWREIGVVPRWKG